MEMNMIVYTMLLLTLYITATATNSTRKRFPPNKDHIKGSTTDISVGTQSTTSYADIHAKHKLYGNSLHQRWEGSTEPVNDCPSACQCTYWDSTSIIHFPIFPPSELSLWDTKLIVQDCRSDPLEEIPKLLESYSNVNVLELNNCRLSRFPQGILKLQYLTVLHLIKNELSEIPDQLQQLSKLRALHIVENKRENLRIDSITKLSNLLVLDLSHNRLASLPEGILTLQLESLDLSFNKLKTLPCELGRPPSLKHVNLAHNEIKLVPSATGALSKLNTPALKGNKIQTLLARRKRTTISENHNNLSGYGNSAEIVIFKLKTTFQLEGNQIRHFKDVFDCWKIVVKPLEYLHILLWNTYFNLAGNPLVCDCVDYEVYRYIQRFRTVYYRNLACHKPPSLGGQNPVQIPLERFVCIVEVNCPFGCTCMKVPHLHCIKVTCESYVNTDLPKTVPALPNVYYQYRIDIRNQSLGEITPWSYLQKAIDIRLSNNSIKAINSKFPCIFQSVRILHLDHNLLQRLPESVAVMTNETAVEVRLGSNPWVCDCDVLAMHNWIKQNLHIVKDEDNIICHSPESMAGIKVTKVDKAMVCQPVNMNVVYIVFAISSIVIIYIVYLMSAERLKYAYRRLVGSDECDGEGKEFDVFMCSADADSDYVENILIPELERRDFRVLYHREHFHPGKPITVNVSEAIAKSKRTLVLFSNNFRESNFCIHEFNEAYHLDVENNTMRLVTIKDTDLDMSELDISQQNYFQTHTYLERADVKFWKLLEGSLPKKRLGAQIH